MWTECLENISLSQTYPGVNPLSASIAPEMLVLLIYMACLMVNTMVNTMDLGFWRYLKYLKCCMRFSYGITTFGSGRVKCFMAQAGTSFIGKASALMDQSLNM